MRSWNLGVERLGNVCVRIYISSNLASRFPFRPFSRHAHSAMLDIQLRDLPPRFTRYAAPLLGLYARMPAVASSVKRTFTPSSCANAAKRE